MFNSQELHTPTGKEFLIILAILSIIAIGVLVFQYVKRCGNFTADIPLFFIIYFLLNFLITWINGGFIFENTTEQEIMRAEKRVMAQIEGINNRLENMDKAYEFQVKRIDHLCEKTDCP